MSCESARTKNNEHRRKLQMADLSRREAVALEIFGRIVSDPESPVPDQPIELGDGRTVIYGQYAAEMSFAYADYFIKQSNV